MNREQQRAMQLAGTVSVPQKFPQLAVISFSINGTEATDRRARLEYLAVDHMINAKLRIRRSFRTSDVTAVFLPQSRDCVDLLEGDWFLGGEIEKRLPTVVDNRGGRAWGIAYVPEQAATLMQVEVGMTAGESVEYYPPLPDDRSVDHYELGTASHGAEGAVGSPEPCSLTAGDPCAAFAMQAGSRQSHAEDQEAFDPCSSLIW